MGFWWNRYWNGNSFSLVSEQIICGIFTWRGSDCISIATKYVAVWKLIDAWNKKHIYWIQEQVYKYCDAGLTSDANELFNSIQ